MLSAMAQAILLKASVGVLLESIPQGIEPESNITAEHVQHH
ncbi:hypothetical protein ADILRU_0277 [Leifsonia rubra CMS 76R]|nr:hypothetical protein ADILRU_0277 [Leifsonia rubra CMS 76R]